MVNNFIDACTNDYLKGRQIEMLYEQSMVSITGVFIASILYAISLWQDVPVTIVLPWLTTFLFVTLFRVFGSFVYFKSYKKNENNDKWMMVFLIGAFISGLMWGLIAFLLIPGAELFTTLLTVLFIFCLAAEAIATYSVSQSAYLAFTLPSVLPLIVILVINKSQTMNNLGYIILLCFCFLLISFKKFNKLINASFKSQQEKEIVMEELKLDISNRKQLEAQLISEKELAEKHSEMMSELSSRDGLTGIYNRRRFDEFMSNEWGRSMRNKTALSLIMCDIDHFKLYNDHYGHQKGDDCLILVAHILEDYTRRGGDFAARYGGEEFVIVLPDTNSSDAYKIAEQIRIAIEALNLKHDASDNSEFVTCSLGIATVIPRQNVDSSSLIKKADEALYLAKSKGRNNLVSMQIE
ncbi:MAG: hypothetical protein DHS20C09_04360 [marine bacterium B5-7]|nr:MAG: hypothetical protein DHS20C09_04360 [marine bacterium B5-7]